MAGRRIRHELVAAVSGLPAAELEAALAETVHHHLLVVDDDGRYRFRHALLREAVLADLLPGERVRLHAAIAGYLRDHPAAGTAAERAHHARESNDLPAAFTASLEAAEEARRGGAPAEQLDQLEAALALWAAVPDAADRAGRQRPQLLVDTALAARAGGDLHRTIALLRAALDELGDDGNPVLRARAHYLLAQALIWVDDFSAAHAAGRAALDLVPAEPPSPVRTWAAATHARASFNVGSWDEGRAAAEEALRAADALGLDAAWADTAVSVVRLHGEEDAAEVRARLDEALDRARRSGDADVEMRVLFNLALVAYECGDLAQTLAWSRAGLERARELGAEWLFYATELRHLLVVAGYLAGDWNASLAAADELARMPEMAAHVRAAGLLVAVGRGDPEVAERIAWAKGLSERRSSPVMLFVATAVAEAEVAARQGNAAAALRSATAAASRLAEIWPADRLATLRLAALAVAAAADEAASVRLRGDAVAAARSATAAQPLLDLARDAVDAYTEVGGVIGIEGQAWQQRLLAEEARLRDEPAPELWQRAAAAFGRLGHVYEEARSRWRLAEALLAVDDRQAAADELRRAHRVAVRLGAEPLRAAVEALARRGRLEAGLPSARRPDPAEVVLTPREAEVLGLLAQGHTNRQIGAALYISEKTASVHVSNILSKLDAGGRTEAVAIAARRGFLPAGGASAG